MKEVGRMKTKELNKTIKKKKTVKAVEEMLSAL